jgi:hypothetical protein
MEAAVFRYYAMEQSTLQEERDVSRMGDGYVEANGLQRHTTGPVQVLNSWDECSRDGSSCLVHTTRINGQNHNTTKSTWW